MSRSEKPSLEKWQYLTAGEALRIYDHFSKRPDQVKELAAKVSLMRVALAVMDVEEREALECDLEKLLASLRTGNRRLPLFPFFPFLKRHGCRSTALREFLSARWYSTHATTKSEV